jgi:amino acid adenylation domain-containing protein/non-ribosomal peptide synthase protein (TIGR01720 family)
MTLPAAMPQPAGFPLSPQQRRLWRLQQSAGAAPFVARCAVEVAGPLDPAVLGEALADLAARHEILRTRFVTASGMKLPLQAVLDRGGFAFSQHRLAGRGEDGAMAELERIWRALGASPPPADDAAPRAELVELSATRWRLLLALPGLCSDGVGLDNLVADLAACLGRRLGGGEPLPEPLQYADLAQWQNELLQSEEARPGREVWQRRSPADVPHLVLPFAPAVRRGGFAPEVLPVAIEPAVVSGIAALSAAWDVPAALIWLGCWQALLSCLGGERDLPLGVGFAGRSDPELEGALGLFSRCLPLRASLDAGEDMAHRVSALAAATAEMAQWQECFAWDDLAPGEPGAAQPYLPVCFEEQPELPVFTAGELALAVVAREACSDRFDLKLVTRGGRPWLAWDSAWCRRADVERLAGQLAALARSLVDAPGAAIADLSMVGAEESAAMARRHQTSVPAVDERSLVERFEEQAAQRPEEPAVVAEDGVLTWRELDQRANQLAHYLRRRGVGPEVRVALLLERTLDAVVAIVGVLKAGGAYVPLDPHQPPARLDGMLAASAARVALTLGRLERDPGLPGVHAVRLDEAAAEIGRESTARPGIATAPENLAYVLFTSGSTGTPKGVAVEQRQLLNYLAGIVPKLDAVPGRRYAMVSTLAADLGNTVLFPALTTGGCLHLIDARRAEDPEALAEYFDRHAIEVLKIVPGHFQALLAAERPARLMPARCLVLGGETCPWELVERVRALRPECRVLNHYGPTETTVGVLVSALAEGPRGAFPGAPIGLPLANTRVHLVDRRLRPVPWGAPGELCIGGLGLARGYLGRPEATAESFVPDPLGGEAGGRLYRTGDLARLAPDGELIFAGRGDQQVKIRGFRIELGEIEAALRQHPAVREAAVIARPGGPGGSRLAAFVVARPESVEVEDLRIWVRDRLPDSMVPAVFVELASLPLTPNGKLDRDQLTAAEGLRPERPYAAPRDAVEQTLAEIWGEVLKAGQIGVHDNFFDLGGDSILSILIVARAKERGLRLTPRQIFEHPTVARLVEVAERSGETVVESEPEMASGEVPLTPTQHAFFAQGWSDPGRCGQGVLFESEAPLQSWWIDMVAAHLVAHHDALRLRFVHGEDGWRQSCAADAGPVAATIDLDALPAAAAAAALREAAARLVASLDLARGPLFRVALFRLGGASADHLLVVAHDLVVDGVSWRILLADFQSAYALLARGLAVALPAKTTSFRAWAGRLEGYGRSAALRQEAEHWARAAADGVSALPVDHPGERVHPGLAGDVVDAALGADETAALLLEVPKAYGTRIEEVLLTALAQAFQRWTGSRSLRLDLLAHGREEEIAPGTDLSRTVGWFATAYPVGLVLPAAGGAGEALKAVKETLRQIPRHGIGYGALRWLSGDASLVPRLAAQPPAAVSFNYRGQIDQVLEPRSTLRLADLLPGAVRPRGHHLIEVLCQVGGGRLQIGCTYFPALHRRETIQHLAGLFVAALQSLIAHCTSAQAASYTPSDFPDSGLSQDDLDAVIAHLRPPLG